MPRSLGFEIATDRENYRLDAYLFGEAQSRVVVSIKLEKQGEFQVFVGANLKIPHALLGRVASINFVIDGQNILTTSEAKRLYDNALPNYLA